MNERDGGGGVAAITSDPDGWVAHSSLRRPVQYGGCEDARPDSKSDLFDVTSLTKVG
jgi:hypothetical protein